MNRPDCKTCVHNDFGTCREGPPVPVQVPDRIWADRGGPYVEWEHPAVSDGDGCGRHQDFPAYVKARREAEGAKLSPHKCSVCGGEIAGHWCFSCRADNPLAPKGEI